jgi:ectoine hydroxylase-related dioxygenase (phytanoyl-CoA dioxygenase family)
VWADYDRKVFDGVVPIETYQQKTGDLYLGRCLNAHHSVPGLKRLTKDPRILDLLSFLLGVRATPFQTIIGYAGSEQKAHSDSIHMSTWPLGYLAAIWIAMEDIHPDCGPLEYYPKSHRLPYVFSHNIERQPRDLQHKRTSWYNEVYEDEIEGIVVKEKLEKKFLLAKKGDVLIWHANLIHGGSPRMDKRLSRKALVAHYFGKGAFCYGDRNEMFCDPYQAE